jgi:TfoX/Sxy family transcriptional regulator of competence genes
MSYDEALADRVKAALGGTRPVEEKRMFGGLTFMVRGKMCVSVGKGRIMCRIDPAAHDDALRRPGCRTVVMNGRDYRGFLYIDAEAVSTDDELNYWVRLALDCNGKAGASSAKRASSRPSRPRRAGRQR